MTQFLRVHKVWKGFCPLLGPSLYVWVQGCPRRCPGCFNTGALDENGSAEIMSTDELVALWEIQGGGVVLSGGEPFSLAESLAHLCRGVRTHRAETPILVYTGYRLEELIEGNREDWLALMREVDVLVDGPFIQARLTDMPLVGSDNQRVILLGNRVPRERLAALDRVRVHVSLDLNGRVRLVGTGGADLDMNGLVESIRAHGVMLEE